MACDDCAVFREELRKEREKPPVEGLMAVAESAARVLQSMAGVNSQTQVAWQARMLAENTLRQVQERLKEHECTS